ncbi:MAG: hypothetical protein LBC46_05950 [Treponema sp.]|jgi:hypothetical protein|nr:hypothetical protein [Treponema sp.]
MPASRLKAALLILATSLGACVAGSGVFLLVITLLPDEASEGYAVLRVDAALPDRDIGERLAASIDNYISIDFVSESTQRVFLNDFDTILSLSLEEYQERLGASALRPDPRDDGYAARLHSFFVRNGQRLFFIPFIRPSLLEELNTVWIYRTRSGNANLEAAIAKGLDGIPFSIEWLGYDREPRYLYIAFADAACVLAFLLWRFALCVVRRIAASSQGKRMPQRLVVAGAVVLFVVVVALSAHSLPVIVERLKLYHAPSGELTASLISAAEYEAHIAFQTSFTLRPLGSRVLNENSYLRYDIGTDGLIAGTRELSAAFLPEAAVSMKALFPLKKLMDFLANFADYTEMVQFSESQLGDY